jgi:hypothetical protein
MTKEYYTINGKQVKAENILKAIKKYMKNKGKTTRQKYVAKNANKIQKYNINYQKTLRANRRLNKVCIICGKEKVTEAYLSCDNCRSYIQNYTKNRRRRQK